MSLPTAFIDLVNGSEFAAMRASRDLNGIAAMLNVRDQRGPAQILDMASYCSKGITGTIKAMSEIPIGSTITSGISMSLDIKKVLHTVLGIVLNDFRLTVCDTDDPQFSAACGVLIYIGAMTSEDQTNLVALGNNQQSRSEVTLGRFCTGEDVRSVVGGN